MQEIPKYDLASPLQKLSRRLITPCMMPVFEIAAVWDRPYGESGPPTDHRVPMSAKFTSCGEYTKVRKTNGILDS